MPTALDRPDFPSDLLPRTLVAVAMRSNAPAHLVCATAIGTELRDALPGTTARVLLASHCAEAPGARRVLGLTLALGRAAVTPGQHLAAYTTASFAALALGHRGRGSFLLKTALDSSGRLGENDRFAALLCRAIYLHEATAAEYRYVAASVALRLR